MARSQASVLSHFCSYSCVCIVCVCLCVCVSVYICVCVRAREREKGGSTERERDRLLLTPLLFFSIPPFFSLTPLAALPQDTATRALSRPHWHRRAPWSTRRYAASAPLFLLLSRSFSLVKGRHTAALTLALHPFTPASFAAGLPLGPLACAGPAVSAFLPATAPPRPPRLFPPQSAIVMHEPLLALVDKLAEITPGPELDSFFFATTGAEAVENAVKVAKMVTGRNNLVVMEVSPPHEWMTMWGDGRAGSARRLGPATTSVTRTRAAP